MWQHQVKSVHRDLLGSAFPWFPWNTWSELIQLATDMCKHTYYCVWQPFKYHAQKESGEDSFVKIKNWNHELSIHISLQHYFFYNLASQQFSWSPYIMHHERIHWFTADYTSLFLGDCYRQLKNSRTKKIIQTQGTWQLCKTKTTPNIERTKLRVEIHKIIKKLNKKQVVIITSNKWEHA